ncbi:MAG: hypothetical protein KAI72_02875, partial [Candidatus Pacebacteria bacterium]|nr:hypothetical protein [Candidatus Paceibacterota bacterium]
DLDGSNFTPTKQTTTAYDKMYSQLQVYGFKTYYTWQEDDGSNQIWTANNWGFNQFLFKLKNSNSSNDQQIDIDWSGQASISSTTIPTITLQLYNYTSSLWENLASSNTYASGTDFTLSGSKTTSLSNYYDADYFAIARVTQGTREIYLETDYISATFTFPTITASGTVYTNEGADHIGSGKTVRIKVNGGGNYATTTDANGEYYIDTVEISSAGDVVTAYIDGETENAVTITRATSTTDNIQGLDLYQNRIITRHEGTDPITIDDLDKYDQTNDDDIPYTANATTDTLTASSTAELFVWTGDTFSTGGEGGSIYLGDVDINGTFTATSTQTIYASSTWDATGGTFNSASSTVTFTSNVSGKNITVNNNPFWNLTFNGSGGTWGMNDNATTTNDLTVTAGTATGTNNIAILGGDATGNGTLTFTGGTFTLDGTGNFQGSTNWTFYNLNLGDETGVATTTKTGSADTIISNVLTIAKDQVLDAGSSTWELKGTGTPFVKTGTFDSNSSTFKYEGADNTNITATTYNNLTLIPGCCTDPTYTLLSGNLSVTGNFNSSASFNSSVTASTTNPIIDIDGNFTVEGDFIAPPTSDFMVGGNWNDSGDFVHNNGTVTLDAVDSGHT